MENAKAAIIVLLLGVSIVFVIVVGVFAVASFSYGRTQLRAFNKINKTSYSISEWRVYEYEIKRMHPFQPSKN